MPRILLPAVVLITVLALACGGDDDDASSTGVTSESTLPAATATAEASGDKPTAAPTPEPGEVSVANEAFSVEAPDGTVLKGHAYTPDGPKRRALIVIAPVEQSVWAESTRAFTSEGIAVFTVDLPGYGETGGSEADVRTLATDVRLLTRFVISREYPLVYLIGFGETGGALVSDDATFQDLQPVVGFVTYGYENTSTRTHVDLAPDAAWAGEDVLADEDVRDAVLEFVLGN